MKLPISLSTNLETRISRTRLEYVFHEFIKNSIHFPLAIIVLILLVSPNSLMIKWIHIIILIVGALLQAYILGSLSYVKKSFYFFGNLIGVSICILYFALNFGIENTYINSNCRLYLAYSLVIGSLQELRFRIIYERVCHVLILMEHFFRVVFLMFPFWFSHAVGDHLILSFGSLMNEPYYIYLIVIICVYGILMGMANINSYRYLSVLQKTTVDLRKYSEWFLGREFLNTIVDDPDILNLKKIVRSIIFMDIRGYTRWSGSRSPDIVVILINELFQISEKILNRRKAIKIELTGDEVMAVFSTPNLALLSAIELLRGVEPLLSKEGLNVGISISTGDVIEGMVGGSHLKKYSVIGDTVNTGKHICEVADSGEILLDENTTILLGEKIQISETKMVKIKGKLNKIKVNLLSLENLTPTIKTELHLDQYLLNSINNKECQVGRKSVWNMIKQFNLNIKINTTIKKQSTSTKYTEEQKTTIKIVE